MPFDLTNLSAGQIAILGALVTLISAVASASASLAGTYVKARMDAKAVAVAAHREYLLREFQPALEHARERGSIACELCADFKTGERNTDEGRKRFEAKIGKFGELAGSIGIRNMVTVISLAQRRKIHRLSIAGYAGSRREVYGRVERSLGGNDTPHSRGSAKPGG